MDFKLHHYPKADLLVTGDKPLLSVKTFGSGKIVSVGDALEIIGRTT